MSAFFEHLQDDPFDLLDVQPLQLFIQEGGRLQPGQLLQADPPFCLREPHQTTRLSAVPTADRLQKLSDLGRQMTLVPDAGLFELLGQS